ncbi:MAG: hypothetical protein RBS77_06325 [Candidatus Moranbacteria bacterium]|jgi:hypothetical protein|nr:hypothetical protein [Candidatus Moranbacteria bacterium]
MNTPLHLKIGRPVKLNKYNRLNSIFSFSYSLVFLLIFFIEKGRIVGFIIFLLMFISGIIFIIKNSIKFEEIGSIIIDDNGLIIKEDESAYEYKFEAISKIIFTYFLPEDFRSLRFSLIYSGYQNRITIVTNKNIKHYIHCSYGTYKQIRKFKNEHNYKIRIRYSYCI